MRFMTHVPLFGCTPDIVFSKTRVLVFVDGDFWHGRTLLEKGMQGLKRSFRSDVRAFWVLKIARNADRDARQTRLLRRNGWAVLRFWEKDVLRDATGAAAVVAERVLQRRAKLKRRQDAA
jgi:DNA mismatch endonuclease (patch repair protein)